jgi:hypothetical protein
MLQDGRSRIRDPMRKINCFQCTNLTSRTRPWWFTQPLTEMSTRNIKIMFLGSRARPVHKADKLIAICKPIV